VELIDDTHELQGIPGTLVRLSEVGDRALTIDPQTATGPTSGFVKNPKVRRWDSPGLVVITPDQWQDLESGVQVMFSAEPPPHHIGDYWLIPARTATGDVEWPRNDQKVPLPQPPLGIHHHYCALAIVEFDGQSWTVVEDCRRLFQPLAEQAIHITSVRTIKPDAILLNDSAIPANVFENGIKLNLDGTLDPSTISQPTCLVTLDLPLQPPTSTVVEWGRGLAAGFLPFILAGNLAATQTEISWFPSVSPATWLNALLNEPSEQRILAHLTVKGNFIWSNKPSQIYLDGEAFGRPRGRSEDIGLPSGDGRRGGTFDMWFWIVKSLDVGSVTVEPDAVAVGDSSTGKVALNGPAPQGGLAVNLFSDIAQVPASVLISEGDSATFEATTSIVGDAKIGASLTGPPMITLLHVVGIAGLGVTPPPIYVDTSVDVAVTLTGTLPKPVSVGISITGSLNLKTSFVIPQGSVGHFFFTPQNLGSAGEAVIEVSLGKSTKRTNLKVQIVG
jgi:hypothetical protein